MNKEIQRFLKRMALGRPIESYPVTITTTKVHDRQVQFCTNLKKDPIQRKHRKGVFYEMHELEALGAHFPKGGTFVDIGANVGNHALYAALFLDAARVIPFEPNPKAYRLLIQNMLSNGVADRVDFSRLGCGLSDAPGDGYAVKTNKRNLGGSKLAATGGDLQVFRADTLLADETPDLIKIDVEGMELSVLLGLSDLLERCTPVLQVEVDTENDEAFRSWVAAAGYTVKDEVRRHKNNVNYLLVHPSATKANAKSATRKTTTAKATTAKTTAKKPTTRSNKKPATKATTKTAKVLTTAK